VARIPPPLARKIDRLARHAHRFHRFAHHPLCREYGGEVVRLGRRTRLCHGCLLCTVGLLSGALGGGLTAPPAPAFFAAVSVAAAALAVVAAGRALHRIKVVTRFAPAALFGFVTVAGVRGGSWLGWVIAAVAVATALTLVRLYRRRGPDRTPCATCPERTLQEACRGLAPIVRRERAFRRMAGRMLARP
jgi:hypothetical protein